MRHRYRTILFFLFIMFAGQVEAQRNYNCAHPTDIHVSFVTGGSALVSWLWDAGTTPDRTIVHHRVDGQTPWTETIASDTCLVITNLTPHTRYEVAVVTICGTDTAVSEPVFFTTPHCLECMEIDSEQVVIWGASQLESSIPITYYFHSYTEQIIRSNELSPNGNPMLLTGISFQYKSTAPFDNKERVEIYLTHREDSVYSNNYDFTPLTDATLVYVGDFYCQYGWNYFEFSTPFYYDGIHNLVVFVLDKTETTSGSGGHLFGCHRIPNNKVQVHWSTTSPLDLDNPFLPSADYIRSNMRFTVCSHAESVPCVAPNIYHHEWSEDSTMFTVYWASGLDDTTWVLRYRTSWNVGWTYDSSATSPYQIYAHSPDNLYDIEIQSKCGDSLYSVWESPFTTDDSPCLPVSNITLSSVTEHSAEITWTPGGNEHLWTYCPVASLTTPAPPPSNGGWITTTNPLVLDSLAEGHCQMLWIRADCGGGKFSSAESFELWTNCHEIDSLPYTEDFNNPEDTVIYHGAQNSGPLPHCWQKMSMYVNTGPYCTSDSCLTFHTTNNEYQIAILPRLSDDLLIDHLKMTFSYRKLQHYNHSSIVIGIMDDPADLSSFTAVDTVTTSGNHWNWLNAEVFFENFHGSGRYIALKYQTSTRNFIKVDNLVIDTAFTCHTPTNLMATGTSPTSVSVTWAGEDGEGEWQVAVVPDYITDPDSNSIHTVHEKRYLATDVVDSNQVFFVRTHCANGWGYSEWVSIPIIPFTHEPATVPYFHNFEENHENAAWRLENGGYVNQWHIGIPNGYSDSLLYITNNHGANASYSNSSSVAWAYRDFFFNGAAEYEVRFKWLCNGETYDYLQALIGEPASIPEQQNYSILYPVGAELLGEYSRQNNWMLARYVFGSEYDNTLQRLYFLWRNDSYQSYPPGAVIDYVQVIPHYCIRPYDLTLDFVGAHGAEISLSSAIDEGIFWEYVILEGDSFPDDDNISVLNTSNTSFSLFGLSDNTHYTLFVRGVCNDGSRSSWSEIKFKTKCNPLVLPYVETFSDVDDSKLRCWSFPAPETGILSPTIHESYYSYEPADNALLRFLGAYSQKRLAILPEVPSDYSLNNLRLSFHINSNTSNSHLIVGVMSDPDDFSTFIPVDTVQTIEPFSYDRVEVFFDQYLGSGTYIAIFSDSIGDNSCSIDVDNLMLEISPTCLVPSEIRVTNVSQHSATISWTPANDEQAWELAYGTADFNPDSAGTVIGINTNPFVLTGLSEGTFYGFYVRAKCSPEEYSEWSPLGYVITRCNPISVVDQPYQESFDNYTIGISSSTSPSMYYPYIDFPNCWSFLNLHVLMGFPSGNLPAAFLSNNTVVWGNSLHFVNSTITPLYAVLPEFVENLRFLKLTFSYKNIHSSPLLSIGYMKDPSDGNTYREVQLCPNSGYNFMTRTIDYSTLGLAPDSNYYIAFRTYDSIWGWYNVALENVKVELVPNAFPAPTQLDAYNITAHNATLDWTNGNDENRWEVQYKLANSSEWTSLNVVSHPVLLDGLAPNTVYDVRVRSIYGDSQTMCSAFTFTFFTTTGIYVPDYGAFDSHVTIWPNPAKQFIDIELDEELSGGVEIQLFNIYGQWIKSIPAQNLSTRINIEELPSGVYIIRVKGANVTATKRFVKT